MAPYGSAATAGGAAGTAGAAPISDVPLEALNQVDAHLRQQGYARVGPAVRNSNMAENGIIAYAIDGRPGLCYMAVAIATAGSDLNMVVLDPAGATVTYNVAPDARPWALFCPSEAGQHRARLQMASGSGEYYYALYQGPTQVRPDLATFYGARGSGGPASAPIDAQTAQRLTALDQRLAGEGYQRAGDPQGLIFSAQEDRNFALNLERGHCYAFATLGGPGARDTDLFLIDGGGNELIRDVETDVDAMVRYCPQQSGAYQMRARMHDGQGPLFAVGYTLSSGGQSASQTPVIAATSTAGANLDENFRLLDADMRARGYEPYGDPSRGQLDQEAARDFEISLEGGKCYAILAVGDTGVHDLDLLLIDRGGRQVDRDVEQDARPVVRVCPERSGDFSMQVRMHRGQGGFVYAPYRWPRGTRGPFGLSGLTYLRLAEVTSLLNLEGFAPDLDGEPGRGTLARQGQTRSHRIPLAAGKCYSILVVGGEGVQDLDVTLSQNGTALASDGTRTAFPNVRHCAQQNGEVELTVEAEAGQGSYFYQAFVRGG